MQRQFNEDFIPTKNPNLIERVNSGPCISIMNLEDEGKLFTLDGLAAQIWQNIDGLKSIQKICDEVSFPPTQQKRFQKDLDKLLHDLKKENLIQ